MVGKLLTLPPTLPSPLVHVLHLYLDFLHIPSSDKVFVFLGRRGAAVGSHGYETTSMRSSFFFPFHFLLRRLCLPPLALESLEVANSTSMEPLAPGLARRFGSFCFRLLLQ
jgi:hypothetical protein